MTKASIIIPASKVDDSLFQSMEHVFANQGDYEVIVACSDADVAKVKSGAPSREIRFAVHDSDVLADLVSVAASQAIGEYISVVCGRQRLSDVAINSFLKAAQADPNLGAIAGTVRLVDENFEPIKTLLNTERRLEKQVAHRSPTQSLLFFKRDAVESVGGFSKTYSTGFLFDLFLKIADHGYAVTDTKEIVSTSLVSGSQLNGFDDVEHQLNHCQQILEIYEKNRSYIPSRWALIVSRLEAEVNGVNREIGVDYDRSIINRAKQICSINNTNTAAPRDYPILATHVYKEFRETLARPKHALRFLPGVFRKQAQDFSKRRLFRLAVDEPSPCYLPKRYFEQKLPENPPKISISTPNWNQGKFIERTIRSVLDQNYPNLEFAVQDGLSTDESVDVIKSYEDQISSWESREDRGQSHAINMGFARTSGEIMAYLNSDDTLVPGSLAYVAQYFEAHPEVDVLYGDRLLIDENDQLINYWVLPEHDSEVIRWADYIPQEAMFWRRSAWDKVGGIDDGFQFAMDWDLILRFRSAGLQFKHVPRFLGAFRITEDQKTNQLHGSVGLAEMAKLRTREFGFNPTEIEVTRRVKRYVKKQRQTERAFKLKSYWSGLGEQNQIWDINDDIRNAPAPSSMAQRAA